MGLSRPRDGCREASRAQGLGEPRHQRVLAVHGREAQFVPVADGAIDDRVRDQARDVVLSSPRGETSDVVRRDLVRLVLAGSEELDAPHGDRAPVRRTAGGERDETNELAALLDGDDPQRPSISVSELPPPGQQPERRAHRLGVHRAARAAGATPGQNCLQLGHVRQDSKTRHWSQSRSICEPGTASIARKNGSRMDRSSETRLTSSGSSARVRLTPVALENPSW